MHRAFWRGVQMCSPCWVWVTQHVGAWTRQSAEGHDGSSAALLRRRRPAAFPLCDGLLGEAFDSQQPQSQRNAVPAPWRVRRVRARGLGKKGDERENGTDERRAGAGESSSAGWNTAPKGGPRPNLRVETRQGERAGRGGGGVEG